MSEFSGVQGLWEDFNRFLSIKVVIEQDDTENDVSYAVIHFIITNTSHESELTPEIIYEEVQLKVGVSPEWNIHTTTNLGSGQSFEYEYRCSFSELTKAQWFIEGRVLPESLFKFRRKAENISRNQQLPVRAYIDYFEKLNGQNYLRAKIMAWEAPGPDTTLSAMKDKEIALTDIMIKIRESQKQFQEFLGFINQKKEREDILRHWNIYQEFVRSMEHNIAEILQAVREKRTDGYEKLRERVLLKLNVEVERMDSATHEFKKKLGLPIEDQMNGQLKEDNPVIIIPPAIPLKEIDLHGNNLEKAIPMVNQFLDDCYKQNVRRVRVIHGKGIFVLQSAIREILKTHKLVKSNSVVSADKDHGGEGATEANLIEFTIDK